MSEQTKPTPRSETLSLFYMLFSLLYNPTHLHISTSSQLSNLPLYYILYTVYLYYTTIYYLYLLIQTNKQTTVITMLFFVVVFFGMYFGWLNTCFTWCMSFGVSFFGVPWSHISYMTISMCVVFIYYVPNLKLPY